MKLLHLADLHLNRERADEALQSLAVARTTAQDVDLVVIAGDIWDSVIQNTAGSRFVELVEAIRSLADVKPVAMIYGTPTHDADGSLDVFTTLSSRCGITILQPGKEYFLDQNGNISRVSAQGDRAILFGVPEPSKKFLMAGLQSKDETEAVVRGALRGLFMGLGTLRRAYADLPCVLLYHGQVAGARLQTGDVLDLGSGIRPSVDDLAAVGADYIALGDIHEPQQVGTLPAYYPGSIYPVNFGETHEAGCNLVEIADGEQQKRLGIFPMTLTRVPFGHPVNRKLSSRYPAQPDPKTFQPGARTWVEITCTKDESATLDPDAMTAKLLSLGAAPGSRVTLNVLPTETVRAGEIVGMTSLAAKVKLWAENSSRELPAGVLAKAEEVEAEAAASGAVGRGDRIKLTRLVLRGAIGLWKKSGLEEIDLNLEEIDEGLVALIGQNGSGKTTLLENMHPWPALLTRSGTLKDHFRLRDSFRDLYWTDVATGAQYRALITINAATASGATEYYLYKDGQPLPGIEGRKDGYVEWVNRLFGSQDLFLRSAFVTQRNPKGVPDLADATPGQRKVLFSSLCGLEYFEAYKTIAKARADELDRSTVARAAEISVLQARLQPKGELLVAKVNAATALEEAQGELDVLLEVGKDKAREAEALAKSAEDSRSLVRQAVESGAIARDAETKAAQARASVESARQAVARRPVAEETIQRHGELTARLQAQQEAFRKHQQAVTAERDKVDELRAEHDAQNRHLRGQFEIKNNQHAEAERKAREAVTAAQRDLYNDQAEANNAKAQAERIASELARPLDDHCPTCRQMLPADALAHVSKEREALDAKRAEWLADVATAEAAVAKDEQSLRAASDALADLEATRPKLPDFQPFVAPASTVGQFDGRELESIKSDLDFLDVDGARAIVSAADSAQARIDELTRQIGELEATMNRELARERELRSKVDFEADAKLAAAQAAHKRYQELYREAQGREIHAKVDLQQAERALAQLEADLAAIADLKASLDAVQATIAEWRILEQACGDKGVPALELDAVAPSISAIANGLLREAFGTRYQLEFSTTRMGGKGSTQHQIEDFLIYVLDTETGESQEIGTLSGGEAVWIRRALYDAFGLIRARSTGLQFLTVFQDEADGQLDPAGRLRYFRMLESAPRQAGRSHTIVITHSTELQELIQARVEVAKLKGRSLAKEAA